MNLRSEIAAKHAIEFGKIALEQGLIQSPSDPVVFGKNVVKFVDTVFEGLSNSYHQQK